MPEGSALGEFLRARRARLRPDQVGLPGTVGRRRTPGLRREELAALAGVGVDYYSRLEQGRERNPGPAVIDALATALRLDEDERGHLLALVHQVSGRRRVPPAAPPPVAAPASARGLLDQVRPWPGLLLTRPGDVAAANPEGLALFTGLVDWPAARRNTVRYVFLHPAAREVIGDWEANAAATVAGLRARTADHPGELAAVRDELLAASPDFRRLWSRYDVRPRRGSAKTFQHPAVGPLALAHQTWQLADSTFRLSLYQPASAADADRLALLCLANV